MGKRKAAVEETKRRILRAAALEYQENGIDDTSMTSVAKRADVAPGTVLYHYPTPHDLAEAVVDGWIEEFVLPAVESIDASAPLEARVADLVRELFDLYERTEEAYRVYQKGPDHPVLQRANDWWERNVETMLLRALGDRAKDPDAMRVVSALVNPGFRGTMLSTGIDPDRAKQVATTLILAWLT